MNGRMLTVAKTENMKYLKLVILFGVIFGTQRNSSLHAQVNEPFSVDIIISGNLHSGCSLSNDILFYDRSESRVFYRGIRDLKES